MTRYNVELRKEVHLYNELALGRALNKSFRTSLIPKSSSMNANVDLQSSSTSPSHPLQRGKACLECRRRKMKCDGTRPVCTPCLRGERTQDCEYTDGQRRPRTLTLEEDIARLRARVQELENPEEANPPVELHAPYARASSSAMGSTSSGLTASHHHASSMTQARRRPSGGVPDPLRVGSEAEVHARRALSVIAPYAAEAGLFLNLDRLRVQGTHVLPALQTALTLWSVHVTSEFAPESHKVLEQTQALRSNLLSQAQTQLACALSTVDVDPDPTIILHVIQTGVLLAYYMQRIGQVVGARYYASGTCALGMLLKLHQSPHVSAGAVEGERPTHGNIAFAFAGCTLLAPALDSIEADERVRAFWAVYTLDRWFGAVGQGPCQSLATDGNAMTVPWPDVGDMEARNVVQHLLNDPNHDFTQDGLSAMHAKASVLLSEATAIAASYVADRAIPQSSTFRMRFRTLDTLLQRCLGTAMTVATEHQPQTPEHALALMTLHLVAFAHITLHRPFIPTYSVSGRQCAEATFSVVRVLDRIGELGVGKIGPIYAIVWTALCLALHDEVLRLRARTDGDPSRRREEGKMLDAIRKLVGMLSALSQGCPSRFFAIKIEAVLPILESLSV